MDGIQRIDIDVCNPVKHIVKFLHEFIVVDILGSNRSICRSALAFRQFVDAAVDCIKHGLGKVCAGTEELYAIGNRLSGNAAGDAVVVRSPRLHHQIVVFVLNRRTL